MKLIGIITGNYEGNNYAKVICTEPVPDRDGCYGENAIISKASFSLIVGQIAPDWELYKNQEVFLSYDRYGRVQEIKIQ